MLNAIYFLIIYVGGSYLIGAIIGAVYCTGKVFATNDLNTVQRGYNATKKTQSQVASTSQINQNQQKLNDKMQLDEAIKSIKDQMNAAKQTNNTPMTVREVMDIENELSGELYEKDTLDKAMKELDLQIGMTEAKQQIMDIINSKLYLCDMIKKGKKVDTSTFGNIVITGNAGTGKSTLAKILSNIIIAFGYADGFTSVDRSQLVGMYQGHSAKQTTDILNSAKENRTILFIDEAYSLVQGQNDMFGKESIDTIVKFMEENKDVIVVLAGYSHEMLDFLNTNTGLKSRFKYNISIKDYTTEELKTIMLQLIASKEYIMSKETEKILNPLIESENTQKEKSGNARLVRNLVEKAIERQNSRCFSKNIIDDIELETLIPSDFNYIEQTSDSIEETLKELNNMVGMANIKEEINTLMSYAKVQKMRREQGLNTNKLNLHILMTGNPGTGKTSVARILGKIYKSIGVLSKSTVIEVSRADLVGAVIGETEKKVKNAVERALGGILFIDEAYTLSGKGENDFGIVAIEELLKYMEDYRDNLMIIVAGYKQNMDMFMETNVGLKSRINTNINFKDYTSIELYEIFERMCKSNHYKISEQSKLKIQAKLDLMVMNKETGFGNGRAIRSLFEDITKNLSIRIIKQNLNSLESLSTITGEDIN